MAYRNRVELIGNLGDDPEVVELSEGKLAVNISIATTKKFRNNEGEIEDYTEWHDVAIYGQSANFAAEYLVKGMLVSVIASLRTRQFIDKATNKKRRVKEIVVNERGHEVQVLCWPTEPVKGTSGKTKPRQTQSAKRKVRSKKPNLNRPAQQPSHSQPYRNRVDTSQYEQPPATNWDDNDEPF